MEQPSADTERMLGLGLIIMLLAQLAMGAVLRHLGWGLHLHLTLGWLALMAAINVGGRAWGRYRQMDALPSWGLALLVCAPVQVALGLAAMVAREAYAKAAIAPSLAVALTTLHQAFGALVLASAVLLAIWCWRLMRPLV